MADNVMIPIALLNDTIDLLESIDISGFDHPIPCLYEVVLSDFLKKRQKLELRRTYADIIFAENDDDRFNARMKYLQAKRETYGRN